MENHMNTKMLVPAALAVALGFSSWSAGAATPNVDGAPVVKTTPATAQDTEAARSTTGGPQAAMHASKSSDEFAPTAPARRASPERAFRTGVGPADMFQLRDNAGG